MMKIKSFVGILFVFALTGCLTTVHIDYDQTADFTKFRTYAWEEGTSPIDSLRHHGVVSAIDDQLAGKGFQKVETGPDEFIPYHAAAFNDVRSSASSLGYGYDPALASPYGRYGGLLGLWGFGLLYTR